MGKWKDLSDLDKGQIVMVRQMGQNISKTAIVVGCFPVCSGYLPKVVPGRTTGKLMSGSWMPKAPL